MSLAEQVLSQDPALRLAPVPARKSGGDHPQAL
jgi:hypothetical protein